MGPESSLAMTWIDNPITARCSGPGRNPKSPPGAFFAVEGGTFKTQPYGTDILCVNRINLPIRTARPVILPSNRHSLEMQ
jgi:hypothetical protein